MKITSVEIHPAGSSDVHILSFKDPRRLNPYNVLSIDGLDADNIIPKHYGDGLYDMSLNDRQLTMKIQLNPQFSINETPSDLRDALYKTIASSRTGLIEFQFKNGTTIVAVLSGWVVKMGASLSERESQVLLTIKAQEPMLRAPTRTVVNVSGFSTASQVFSDDLSTAPHGYILEVRVTISDIAGIINIYDPLDDSWYFQISPPSGSSFILGDIIHVSSEQDTKDIYLIHDGDPPTSKHYLAEGIVFGSVWPLMFPGQNQLAFSNNTHLQWVALSYYPTYWGV